MPYLLGFHPHRSLVVMGLTGSRSRVGVTMRMDLDGMPPGQMATRVVRALQQDGDTQAIVLVYDPEPTDPASTPDGLQPGEDVVAAVRSGLRTAGIALKDALRISAGRWWSYLCRDEFCCPSEGSPIAAPADPGGPSLVAATAVHAGLSALPDRDALRRSLEPPAPWVREATRQAMDRVGDALVRQCADDQHQIVDQILAEVDSLICRFEGRSPSLEPDEAARVALGLHLLQVRDAVITWTVHDDAEALQRLLVELVRRVGAPEHVPAATVLAWCAYLRGNGALAGVALELVEESEPDYSLAQLLSSMLENGIHPDRLRESTEATAEEIGRPRRAGESREP